MLKWLKYILGILIIALLVRYLGKHWHQLEVLLKLKLSEIFALYLLTALGTTNNSRIYQLMIRELKADLSLYKAVILQSSVRILNYIPMKFGTVFRANYLKKYYGLSYTHSITVLSHLALLTAITAGLIGFVALTTAYGLRVNETRILAMAFIALATVGLVFYFVPLPVPKSNNKMVDLLRKFIGGREIISRNLRTTSICVSHFVLTFAMASMRFWIIYRSLDIDISFAGCVVLGAVGYGSVILGLTPGSLGVRELLLGAAAVVIGVPLEVGVFVAMFDRAIMLSWTFVVGGGCVIWLWHEDPQAFKKVQQPVDWAGIEYETKAE